LAHDLKTRACEKLTAVGSGRSEPPGTAVCRRTAGPALGCRDSDNIIHYVFVELQALTKNVSMRRGLIRRLYVLYVGIETWVIKNTPYIYIYKYIYIYMCVCVCVKM